MGFNFRKSIKIAPGIRLNIGKKGISSVSFGGKGARVSVSKKGTRTSVGVPGTGLSYSKVSSFNSAPTTNSSQSEQQSLPAVYFTEQLPRLPKKSISLLLCIGIFLAPFVFSWFTLKKGYGTISKVAAFVWLAVFLIIGLGGK